MAAIILLNPDCPEMVEILPDEEGQNMVFETMLEADEWLWDNAKNFCITSVKIINLDD